VNDDQLQNQLKNVQHDIMNELVFHHGDLAVVIQIRKLRDQKGFAISGNGPEKWAREIGILKYMAANLVPKGADSEMLYDVLGTAFKGMVDQSLPFNARPGLRIVKPVTAVDLNNLGDVPREDVVPSQETPTENPLHTDRQRLAALADVPDDMPVKDGNRQYITDGARTVETNDE